MRQVIYRSITTSPSGRAADDLPGILRDAISLNGIEGITGLLYTEAESFLQVIEGAPEIVADLLQRLHRDPRHRDLDVLVDRAAEQREFGDWAMIHRERRETTDEFDDRLRVMLSGVSPQTSAYFRSLSPA